MNTEAGDAATSLFGASLPTFTRLHQIITNTKLTIIHQHNSHNIIETFKGFFSQRVYLPLGATTQSFLMHQSWTRSNI